MGNSRMSKSVEGTSGYQEGNKGKRIRRIQHVAEIKQSSSQHRENIIAHTSKRKCDDNQEVEEKGNDMEGVSTRNLACPRNTWEA